MKVAAISLSFLALVFCAGCASNSGMGASSQGGTVCKDGYHMPPNGNCVDHGGFERAYGPPTPVAK